MSGKLATLSALSLLATTNLPPGLNFYEDGDFNALQGLGMGVEYEADDADMAALGRGSASDFLRALSAGSKSEKSNILKRFLSLANPGSTNEAMWSAFKKYAVGLPIDIVDATIEDNVEYFDTFSFVQAAPAFAAPWTPFLSRQGVLPGICNLARGESAADRPMLVRGISVYFLPSLILNANADAITGYATDAQANTAGRRALIDAVLDNGQYIIEDGSQTVRRGRLAHLTEAAFGSNPQYAAATTVAASTVVPGKTRNGLGKRHPFKTPLFNLAGRPLKITISMPTSITLLAGEQNLAMRVALYGDEVRPGGMLK